jgi:hypothetical protein
MCEYDTRAAIWFAGIVFTARTTPPQIFGVLALSAMPKRKNSDGNDVIIRSNLPIAH